MNKTTKTNICPFCNTKLKPKMVEKLKWDINKIPYYEKIKIWICNCKGTQWNNPVITLMEQIND